MATAEANVDISIPFNTETILFDISQGKLSTLLEIVCKSIGISCSSHSKFVTLVPNDGPCEQIDVAVLGDDNYNIQQLDKRLGEEVSMLNFILDEVAATTRTIDERNKSQVHWSPKSKPKSSSSITDMKLRIVWLIYELNRCQLSVLKLAQNGKISQFGTNGMVKIETMVDQGTAAYSSPLFRPFPDDLKPSNISFETLILVRDFAFNKIDINPAVRVELVKSLQRDQMDRLQRTPEDFFVDIIRCMGMSGQEFINACFKYSKDGKKLARPRCPCGVMHLKETNVGIRKHADKCRFSEFVSHSCPSILQDSVYSSTQAGRVMGTKETAYIIDVIKKRLPRDEWKNTFCGAHLQKEDVVQGD